MKIKLSNLMGIHKVNIQSVHEGTGITRNTISNLYHEKVTRLDFNTLERLCNYFECEVGDLIEIENHNY